jgi:hypothetical protein
MTAARIALCAGAVFAIAGAGIAAPSPGVAPLRAADLPGTYELVDRVLASGKVLRRPEIAALYSFGHGRANFNLFLRNPSGTLASESSIVRYTLSDTQYCEWIEYTTRYNLDAPGVTNKAPLVSSHCAPIRAVGDRIVFYPPGESVATTFDRHGFTAVIKGQFTDHWRKVE